MLIPYRVKNPPKHFPYATISLIAANFLVFILTSSGMVIRMSVLKHYAYTFPTSPLINFITSDFLHGDIFHIAGNMLFLWVFGPPVEDRLGIGRYLALYFFTGFLGSICEGGLSILIAGKALPIIGASGCIMGVVGAYWYLFSWSTVCVFYWFGWFWRGVREVKAVWIIGLYVGMDVLDGVLKGASGVSGGVASFAHVGGAFAGLLMCCIGGIKRDNAEMSTARAIHADMGSLNILPFGALRTMIQQDPHNIELLRAMSNSSGRIGEKDALDQAFESYGSQLAAEDHGLVARYLTVLGGKPELYSPSQLLLVAGAMERAGNVELAIQVYQMIADGRPTDPCAETALYQLAVCAWKSRKDANTARSHLAKLKERFPYGERMIYANQLWNEIGPGQQQKPVADLDDAA